MLKLNVQLLTILVGTVVPLLDGAVLHWTAPRALKSLLNLGLSAAAGVGTLALTHNGLLTRATFLAWFFAYAGSILSHYGVWVPTGLTDLIHWGSDHGLFKNEDLVDQKAWATKVGNELVQFAEQRLADLQTALVTSKPMDGGLGAQATYSDGTPIPEYLADFPVAVEGAGAQDPEPLITRAEVAS